MNCFNMSANNDKKTVLITGASGFIGKSLCSAFSLRHRVIALSRHSILGAPDNYISERADIEDDDAISHICSRYQPDVVIHCAGLSHQKNLCTKKRAYLYERINSLATEKIACSALSFNPDLYFIFLSSISVYGENQNRNVVSEDEHCLPTSHYAESKLSAENRLIKLYNDKRLKRLDILRLAPVYDNMWSFNLEKRVFFPQKIFYLRFGSGEQRMSALARKNLVEFIGFRLDHLMAGPFCSIMNVCDEQPYSFNDIIEIFRESKYQPRRIVIKIPLYAVGLLIGCVELLLDNHSVWIHSFYNKLAKNLIFDNKRMFDTGFKPRFNLKAIFNNGVSK